MADEAARPRSPAASLLLPALLALAAFVLFVALGTWQVERKAWKEALISRLEQRLAAAPAELPPRARWARLDRDSEEFRRLKFSAAFAPGAEALIYTSGSSFRPDVSGPGYWAFAPARLAAGGVVVVNRGFIPEGRQDPATRAESDVAGRIDMVGVMRWPEARGFFTPNDQPQQNLWFARDPMTIAASKGWGDVAPFFIELEGPPPPGGLPQPGALKLTLRNEHLQYAMTWYGLALIEAIMFALWVRSRLSQRHA
jgi:surfeit locus 1 family protein